MKHPIILRGRPFDWEEGARYASQVQNDDGTINWRAAFSADPGVHQCPACGLFMWREGEVVMCPDCGRCSSTKWPAETTALEVL